MPDLAAIGWIALAAAAVMIGLSKTAVPGMATISVALYATVLPAKQSTAAMLLLLLVGDAFALAMYRRHADVRTLVRLIPAVVVGVAAGAAFLALASDAWVRRVIGVILLVVIVLTLWRRRRARGGGAAHHGVVARGVYGSLGGFTTMVANAGGPVMSMYFLAMRFSVKEFLGTAAWFFAAVNVAKLPVSISLGLVTPEILLLTVVIGPGVVVGALVGRRIAAVISQRAFDIVVIVGTLVGAVYLLV